MATIEERAKAQLFGFDGVFDSEDFVRRIIYVATDQDRIARQEEREKAELNFCIACDSYDCCEQRYDCKLFNKFSKAMKGGRTMKADFCRHIACQFIGKFCGKSVCRQQHPKRYLKHLDTCPLSMREERQL